MKLTKIEIDFLILFKEFCQNFKKSNNYINYRDNNAKFEIAKQEFFKKNNISSKLKKLTNLK